MSSANLQAAPAVGLFRWSLDRDLRVAVERAARHWDSSNNTRRLWDKDALLWTNTDESRWLGWLDIVERQLAGLSKFKALAAEIHEDGFKQVLLLGAAGATSAAAVFSHTFKQHATSPALIVLDSIDPVQLRSTRESIDPARTLFCLASQSGPALEPNLLLQYFFEETRRVLGESAGDHFIAITEPGSKLESLAEQFRFRRVYYADPGIGEHYSALSDLVVVPHAAAGLDTERLLRQAALMLEACRSPKALENPGVALGLILGTAAMRFGRNKITLLCSESICGLDAWLAQLIAGATGKQGTGLIPVVREPLAPFDLYSTDRVFVQLRAADDSSAQEELFLAALEMEGHPVLRLQVNDFDDLGQTFFQWEVAAAVAGSVLGINPFDHRDGHASQSVTIDLAGEPARAESISGEQPILSQDGLQLFADEENAGVLLAGSYTLGAVIRKHLDRLRAGDYFSLLVYFPIWQEYEQVLAEIRKEILEAKQTATVVGSGSRLLDSLGRSDTEDGVFLQITCEQNDLPVPGRKYTFGSVRAVQAQEDSRILAERHKRALRIHLGADIEKNLRRLRDLVCAAVAH